MENTIVIVDGVATAIDDDPWNIVSQNISSNLTAYEIIAFIDWQKHLDSQPPQDISKLGVSLQPDDDPAVLTPWVSTLPLIVLEFPSFKDGRAYTQAALLRTRYGFKGDLRAVGDVLRDQLAAMRHCGFSSFNVRKDKSAVDALKGLTGFDMIYARSVTNPEPLFRNRI
jgi:uncharacterized protein (DUF934 family)